MFKELAKMEVRYDELEELLSSSEVLSDREKSNKLAKELSDLREPVSLFREHKRVLKEIKEMEIVLEEKHDKEFLELAKKEVEERKWNKKQIQKTS